jgi:hypothetical protein
MSLLFPHSESNSNVFYMIHEQILMTHYGKQNQQVHMTICAFILLLNSAAFYMFRPPIVAVIKGVSFEGYIK